ncbi:MAG: YidC/Oxa1 family insertase periplasmic-domain containing protein [Thermoguttaceae bacterium]|nr:YidC/Oxa1 family insertase periplasmic-domain containing protein [Thermoguttaceae bacterium]MDW8039040.1 YidC/Oxa1 family insertase periplasmic-domain containing protein [Thermoguttaceae bacterium]
MERRFILFLVLSFCILVGYQYLMVLLFPPAPKKPKVLQEPVVVGDRQKEAAPPQEAELEEGKQKSSQPKGEKHTPKEAKLPPPKSQPDQKPEKLSPKPEEKEDFPPERGVTLGSADPSSPYRMLVTLTNRGAAVVSVELNSPRYQDLTDPSGMFYDRSGYLGRVWLDENQAEEGCRVDVVGPGTPAERAGLRVGDIIQTLDDTPIRGPKGLREVLAKTRPGQTIRLNVLREGKPLELEARLGPRPLAVIRPEGVDPLSFLLTLAQVDEAKLNCGPPNREDVVGRPPADLDKELPGVRLRYSTWEIVRHSPTEAVFRRRLLRWNLEVVKTYRLAELPPEDADDPSAKAYHLQLAIELRNSDSQTHQVAYQLDGPNGLPIEGWWYAAKVSRSWGAVGVRDVAVSFGSGAGGLISCQKIADHAVDALPWRGQPIRYIGVDAQYFSVVLLPHQQPEEDWFSESWPMLVGPVHPEHKQLGNVSFRLVGAVHELKPGQSLRQEFTVFVGPKQTALLAHYGLSELVYYGWYGWVAKPLAGLLHLFYRLVGNYGIAIVLLTVVVRLAMFPLSKKQTLNVLKMQQIQPELKKIYEKYKNDLQARTRAQQELFRKHNYNPMSGCLILLLQLPIFVALYRALMVDVELRQAPLFSEAIRWCSNLSAPDMFLDWSWLMPEFVSRGQGFFGLGPYLNLLPILTIALFLWQQKKMMPPPADEQAAMQQKVMTWMLIFMGLLFYKVASGLCLYFIASTLWGMAERRFLPKTLPDQEPSAQARQRMGFWQKLQKLWSPDGTELRSFKKKKTTDRK